MQSLLPLLTNTYRSVATTEFGLAPPIGGNAFNDLTDLEPGLDLRRHFQCLLVTDIDGPHGERFRHIRIAQPRNVDGVVHDPFFGISRRNDTRRPDSATPWSCGFFGSKLLMR